MAKTKAKNWSTVRAHNRYMRGRGLVRVKAYRKNNKGKKYRVITWRKPNQNQSRAAGIIGWLRSL